MVNKIRLLSDLFGKSYRRCAMKFSRIIGVWIVAIWLTAGLQNAFAQNERVAISSGARQFRNGIATAMRAAAKKSRVSIDTNKMVVTNREDTVIAVAPIIDKRLEEGDPQPDQPVK